ncbi:MAG: B12-binding domain-containing radical SAM protein [bacterium]
MPARRRMFPWGFATIARLLEDDGHEISVLDIYAHGFLRDEVEKRLNQLSVDCICITGFSSSCYLYVVWLAKEIKKRYQVPVIVGGLLASYHFNFLLSKGTIDICVIGEGERTVVDLFRNFNRLSVVKGISYRDKGGIKQNQPRELIDNLDILPLPNFERWPMERYTMVKMYADDPSNRYEFFYGENAPELQSNMTLLSGRGCSYKCAFCSPSYNSLRLKSMGKLMEEIKFLKDSYQIKAVYFVDELLIVNKKRTMEFCREIKKLDLFWNGQSRINNLDRETLLALKESKCLSLAVGVESGSDKILKAMKKGITREQSLKVLREVKEARMHLKILLMFGYPGETKETLSETASLIKKAGLPPRRLNWTTPLPGSELYEQVKQRGLITDEEAYIMQLNKGFNRPDNVVLNVSGKSDEEMIRLFEWIHLKMEVDYFLNVLREPQKVSLKKLWNLLTRIYKRAVPYYKSCMRSL